MKNYSEIVWKNFKLQWRRSVLISLAVILSIAFTVVVFSLLDSFFQFQINKAKYEVGDFQFAISGCNEKEIKGISERKEVSRFGKESDLGLVKFNSNITSELDSFDTEGLNMMGLKIIKGRMPSESGEIAVEEWLLKTYFTTTDISSMVDLNYDKPKTGAITEKYTIVGILADNSISKARNTPRIVINEKDSVKFSDAAVWKSLFWVKRGYSVQKTIDSIKNEFNVQDSRIIKNNVIIALTDPTRIFTKSMLYICGLFIIGIVMFAAIVMIYSAINISVHDRVRMFSMLKCIGSQPQQIKVLVLKEGLTIALVSIIPGIFFGIAMSAILVLVIKSLVYSFIGEFMPYMLSWPAIIAGIVIGFATVLIASFIPAARISKISPIDALSGSAFNKLEKKRKALFITRVLPIEIRFAIRNIFSRKKSFINTIVSLASGLIILMTFNILIEYWHASVSLSNPSYCDFSIKSSYLYKEGKDADLTFQETESVCFNAEIDKFFRTRIMNMKCMVMRERLTKEYVNMYTVQGIDLMAAKDEMYTPNENVVILSYNLHWLTDSKSKLISGSMDRVLSGDNKSVLVIAGGVSVSGKPSVSLIKPVDFHAGDKIAVDCGNGFDEYVIEGVLSVLPDGVTPRGDFMAMVVNEDTFERITGKSTFQQLDIKLKTDADAKNIEPLLRNIAAKDPARTFSDLREINTETEQLNLAFSIFVYGFVFIIGLTGLLNILNLMSMNIISRTKEIGLLKATGMTNKQLYAMILSESAFYGVLASLVGSVAGLLISKFLHNNLVRMIFGIEWQVPVGMLILGCMVTIVFTIIATIYPMKRVNKVSTIEATRTE